MRYCCALLCLLLSSVASAASPPNIVYILCDDLGYGDIQFMAPKTSRIPTPHTDRLASQGMIFTDAHSGSAVCTPTRYGIMTGRYSWRTRLQQGVVQGFAPALIAEDRMTVAGFLQQHGYHTAVIGKWHLDFQYQDPDTRQILRRKNKKVPPPVGALIPDGPVHRGFDFFHGFHHAGNMEAVIENDRVIMHDDVTNMLPRLAEQSVAYIDSRAQADQPFFLYLPLSSPHTPIVPTKQWQGKSGINKYADFVMQTDDVVGQVTSALQRHKLTDNTLVIFTSDNGTSRAAKFDELLAKGHHATAHLKGSKTDIWDGGHRVPFIVRWPGHVAAGSQCDQTICHTDLFATVATLLGEEVPPRTCEDSVSFLPALSGNLIDATRKGIIHHSGRGLFAYRQGSWKLILARASGGWTAPEANAPADAPYAQLYDLQADPSETTNLYTARPQVFQALLSQLTQDVQSGRSTDGPASANDVENIVLWKSGQPPRDR